MIEQLVNIPISDALSWALAIFSTVFAVYTWIKGKERKEFSYAYVSDAIIRGGEKQNPALKVTYNGIEVENLTSTKIAIWNSGNKVLSKQDMVVEKELTVTVGGSNQILAFEIVAQSDETNKFILSKSTDSTQSIAFDYADVQEGAVIQVFHTGYNDAVKVDGKIKGGKPINHRKNNQKEYKNKDRNISRAIAVVVQLASALVMPLISIVVLYGAWNPGFAEMINAYEKQHIGTIDKVFTSVLLVLMNCMMIKMSFSNLQNEFHISIPAKLRKYM